VHNCRILWARELVEPNRAEFARTLGVDRTTVQKIEDGDRPPSIFNVLAIAHALRVTPNYILIGSMQGVDGELAAALAAAHPQLANRPASPEGNPDRATDSGTPKQPRKRPGNRRKSA
jgi:DNA-binding XRE family transcriptional regulator